MARLLATLALCLSFLAVVPAAAQQALGDAAPEFPAGPFTDGGHYKLGDLKGKLVVLYFFECDPRCKTCRAIIPERTAVVRAFQGKPVKFLGVAANVTLAQAVAFQSQTGLPMPIFADSLGLMQARYGFKISLQNMWAIRLIGPTGAIAGDAFDKEAIERALKKNDVQSKHDFAQYDGMLRQGLELLEFGQYGRGVQALSRFTKVSNKAQAEGAKKLIAEVKAKAMTWKLEADGAVGIEPLKAYDLYQKIAAVLPADELGKSSTVAAKKLAADKSIAPELAARKSFAVLTQTMGQVTAAGQGVVMAECKNIAKRYPGTPTADKADDLYRELGGKEAKSKEPTGKGGKKAG